MWRLQELWYKGRDKLGEGREAGDSKEGEEVYIMGIRILIEG